MEGVSGNCADILKEKFKDRFKFINAGINSHLAYNLFIRLDKVIKCSPAKITILIGTNDVNSSLSEVGANMISDLISEFLNSVK